MVPASISVLKSLPLSPTGKVDRSKLPAPVAAVPQSTQPAAAPKSAIEAQLVDIWRHVLTSDAVGVDDNFFDLGGTSLQLIQVHATMVSIMKCDVSVVDLFQYPRISALAAWLTQKASPAAAAPPQIMNIDDRARKQQAALALARARPSGRRLTR
jgi:non-ribosomal peptide synthetase component F